MKVKLTQSWIDRGTRAVENLCPVALLLQDLGYRDARVWSYSRCVQVSFALGNSFIATVFIIDDSEMARRLNHYDDTGEMEEFEFEVPVDTDGKEF